MALNNQECLMCHKTKSNLKLVGQFTYLGSIAHTSVVISHQMKPCRYTHKKGVECN